jgi:hypothetical protein
VLVPEEEPEKLAAEILPARVRAPAEVILLDEEKNCISPVAVGERVNVPVPFGSIVRASFNPEEVTEKATPAPAAADFTLRPVAEETVEASMVRAGLVPPFAPTTNAVALFEVRVVVPPTVRPVRVPREVKEEPVTPEFNVVPVRVPAAAVTVMLAVPSKVTPLIVLPV